jgi:hypothetical protein
MSDNHARAHARETDADAIEWLAEQPSRVGGKIGMEWACNPLSAYEWRIVMDAFAAGWEHQFQMRVASGDEIAVALKTLHRVAAGEVELIPAVASEMIEIISGLEQELEVAKSMVVQEFAAAECGIPLLREAAELFRTYERHHREKAAQEASGQRAAESLEKAQRNAEIADRIERWLAGLDLYPASAAPSPDPDLEAVEALRMVHDGGPVSGPAPDLGLRCDHAERMAEAFSIESAPALDVNVRPVTDGPLAEPGTVEALLSLVEQDGMVAINTAQTFRTADPRFDPAQPVIINGYTFRPTTED